MHRPLSGRPSDRGEAAPEVRAGAGSRRPGDEDYEFVYDSISLRPDGTAWIRSRHGPPTIPPAPPTEEFARWTLEGHGLTLRRICDPRPVPCLAYTWVHRYRVRGDRLLSFHEGTLTAEYEAVSAAAP